MLTLGVLRKPRPRSGGRGVPTWVFQLIVPAKVSPDSYHQFQVMEVSKPSGDLRTQTCSFRSWHQMGQRRVIPAKPCPNCRFMKKKNNVIVALSLPSVGVICYTVLDNWNTHTQRRKTHVISIQIDEFSQSEHTNVTTPRSRNIFSEALFTPSSGHWLPRLTTLLTAWINFAWFSIGQRFIMAFVTPLEEKTQNVKRDPKNKEPQLQGGFPVKRGLLGVIDWIVSPQNPYVEA